jgi:hypothetical protein
MVVLSKVFIKAFPAAYGGWGHLFMTPLPGPSPAPPSESPLLFRRWSQNCGTGRWSPSTTGWCKPQRTSSSEWLAAAGVLTSAQCCRRFLLVLPPTPRTIEQLDHFFLFVLLHRLYLDGRAIGTFTGVWGCGQDTHQSAAWPCVHQHV